MLRPTGQGGGEEMTVHLRVGDLARHTGLTVRTLHHYDAIGLLSPSARSDAGYRLYSSDDIARLHGIQALRHLGLGLKEIRGMLAGHGDSLPANVARQIRALDHEIEHATELRARLSLLQGKLAQGKQPDLNEWLRTLELMSTYGKYFSADELKKIFAHWNTIKPQWPPLFKAVRSAMDRGLPPQSLEVQPTIHRWMNLMARWMDGDFDLMTRWGHMHEQEPRVRTEDAPDLDMIRYVGRAIDARMAVLRKYFDTTQIQRLGAVDDKAWHDLGRDVRRLMRRDAPLHGAAAQALVRRWWGLIEGITGGNAAIRQKLVAAYCDEPLLRASALLEDEVRDFLYRAQAAQQARSA